MIICDICGKKVRESAVTYMDMCEDCAENEA